MVCNKWYDGNFCRQIRITLHKLFHSIATEKKKKKKGFISAPYLKLLLLFHCMSLYANNLNRTSLYTHIDEEINGSVMV